MPLHRLFCLALMLLLSAGVHAQQPRLRHALLIGVATYADPRVPALLGVAADMQSARQIAQAMGIPGEQITVLRDAEATKQNIVEQLERLGRRAGEGSRVLVYFSGHGTRWHDAEAGGCVEGLLTHDSQAIVNREFARLAQPLGAKADKVIIMFDACHSGGVGALRSLPGAAADDRPRAKFFVKADSAPNSCSLPSNVRTRTLLGGGAMGIDQLPENVVQITSSRPDEVSFDEAGKGGLATQGVRNCLLGQARDLDRSGAVTMAEVEACAQDYIRERIKTWPDMMPQHVSVSGLRNLIAVPVAVAAAPAAAVAAEAAVTAESARRERERLEATQAERAAQERREQQAQAQQREQLLQQEQQRLAREQSAAQAQRLAEQVRAEREAALQAARDQRQREEAARLREAAERQALADAALARERDAVQRQRAERAEREAREREARDNREREARERAAADRQAAVSRAEQQQRLAREQREQREREDRARAERAEQQRRDEAERRADAARLAQLAQQNKARDDAARRLEAATAAAAATATQAAAPVGAVAALRDLYEQRDRRHVVDARVSNPRLTIGRDMLEMTVTSSRGGYLYIVLLGSDETSFYMLFPNGLDRDNRVQPGVPLRLPRPNWQVQAPGPAGTDNLLVIVADAPRDLSQLALGTAGAAGAASPFVYTSAGVDGRGKLIGLMLGDAGAADAPRFGASWITVEEVAR